MFVDLKNWLRDYIYTTSEDMYITHNLSYTLTERQRKRGPSEYIVRLERRRGGGTILKRHHRLALLPLPLTLTLGVVISLGVQKNFFFLHTVEVFTSNRPLTMFIYLTYANSVFQSGRDYRLCMGHMAFLLLVSTYVVCERLSVMQRHTESVMANFVLKILNLPLNWNWFQITHPPLGKLKFRQILALWVLTFQNTPHPWKLKFRQILALWVLTVGVCGD